MYNNWRTGESLQSVRGDIAVIEGTGLWEINATSEYTLRAKVWYHSILGGLPVILGTVRSCRAETTGTGEIKGDFNAFSESEVVVDSYTAVGISYYDAVGGGPNPSTYPGEGWYSVLQIGKVWNGQGYDPVSNARSMGTYCNQTYSGNSVSYHVYARGKQYIHNNKEELAKLWTEIEVGDPSIPGWQGTLTAYDAQGNVIHIFPVKTS